MGDDSMPGDASQDEGARLLRVEVCGDHDARRLHFDGQASSVTFFDPLPEVLRNEDDWSARDMTLANFRLRSEKLRSQLGVGGEQGLMTQRCCRAMDSSAGWPPP